MALARKIIALIEQPFDIRYAAGKDPQIERALEELSKDRRIDEKPDVSAP